MKMEEKRTDRIQEKYLNGVELVQKYAAESLLGNPDLKQLQVDDQYLQPVSSSAEERPISGGIFLRRFALEHLHGAQDLVRRVFQEDRADLELACVAHNQPYYEIDGDGDVIVSSEYWVAVDTLEDNRVVGIVGICFHASNYKEVVWGNWLCVDPKYRGMGIGRFLGLFDMKKAYESGRQRLKVFSEDDDCEREANQFYAFVGFKVVKLEPLLGTSSTRLWYELDLNKKWPLRFAEVYLEFAFVRSSMLIFNKLLKLI